MAEGSGATEDPARLKQQIGALEAEVDRLHRKLEELHVGDYNALKRAYTALCQHVDALEAEAGGMVAQLGEFETEALPPEVVAKELGVAVFVTVGAAIISPFVRALPFKGAAHTTKGLWLLGGAFVLFRLTSGALVHVAVMFSRNVGRKRRLMRKLATVEERIAIMSALQQWAEKQQGPAAAAAAGGEGEEGGAEEEEAAAALSVAPPRRVSPAVSSGSSAELVEMPRVEELEAAEAGEAGGPGGGIGGGGSGTSGGGSGSAGGGAGPAGGSAQRGPPARSGSGLVDPGLLSLKAYAELGQRK